MITSGNLYEGISSGGAGEDTETLLAQPGIRMERIVSHGHASPPGFWYDQPQAEWVVVLCGEAKLRIEQEDQPRLLKAGDWVDLPARCRHRVEWTAADRPTVWLAIHRL